MALGIGPMALGTGDAVVVEMAQRASKRSQTLPLQKTRTSRMMNYNCSILQL